MTVDRIITFVLIQTPVNYRVNFVSAGPAIDRSRRRRSLWVGRFDGDVICISWTALRRKAIAAHGVPSYGKVMMWLYETSTSYFLAYWCRMHVLISVCGDGYRRHTHKKKTKLAPYGTEGRLLTSDVSANFKVTWHKILGQISQIQLR